MIPFLHAVGERNCLYPLTESMATPVLPIANRPVVVYAVELLARFGYRKIFVSLHHTADHIALTLGNGQRWNVQFDYLLQRKPLGISGLLKCAASQLTETCLILPADMLIDFDIQAALNFHRAHGCEATVLLYPAERAPAATATLTTEELDCIVKPTASQTDDYVNTQVYLVEPSILNRLQHTEAYDQEPTLLTALLGSGVTVHGQVMKGYWNPLTSFSEFQAAQQAVLASMYQATAVTHAARALNHKIYVEGKQIHPGVWCGPATSLHPSVQFTPPVYIGPNCRIGRDVELGPGTVIGGNCVIDDGATIRQSTVLANTYVGQYTHVERRLVHQELLVDIETGEHVHLTDPFLLSPVDVKAVNTIIWNVIERILAFIGLGLTLPLLGLIGALLWLTEGSSPLTSVERVGRKPNPWATGGATEPQVIRLYHLRTRRADGTYTWLGAWLEATELSRLPELWHVVRSELGLVGVKSLPPETAERIVEPWQRKRYDYQAGFTGLWYTETLPHADFDEQCIVDAYHAAIHNWRNALQCLWRTPGAWWRRMGNSRHGQSVAPKRTPKRVPKRLRKEFARFVQLNLGESTSRDSAWQ